MTKGMSPLRNRPVIGLTVFTLLLLGGCGRREEAEEKPATAWPHTRASTAHERQPAVTAWPASNAPAADLRAWNTRTLVGAYDDVGVKDPKWDAAARAALTAFADSRAHDTNATGRMPGLVKQALKDGCTDPLVTYLGLRFVHGAADRASTNAAQAYRQAADALAESKYPPIRKFYASLRAAQACRAAFPQSEGPGRNYSAYRHAAFQALCEVCQSAETPAEEALDAAEELMNAVKENDTHEDQVLPTLVEYFGRRWPADARARLLRGRAQIALAWNRRGGGYANTVTDEGWKAYGNHLEGAALDLEESWRLDPAKPDAAVEMMRVELGQGQGRARLERWFERAMKVDPACFSAAHEKAWYLQPKWHGSVEEAIAFGRECVRSTEWKGRVPLVLWYAHQMLAQHLTSAAKEKYWLEPGVWNDVEASFERFFALNPNARGWRHDYALYAYKCRQYGKFLDLLPTLGTIQVPFFGGQEGFDRMLSTAEMATGRKAALPKPRETEASAQ